MATAKTIKTFVCSTSMACLFFACSCGTDPVPRELMVGEWRLTEVSVELIRVKSRDTEIPKNPVFILHADGTANFASIHGAAFSNRAPLVASGRWELPRENALDGSKKPTLRLELFHSNSVAVEEYFIDYDRENLTAWVPVGDYYSGERIQYKKARR